MTSNTDGSRISNEKFSPEATITQSSPSEKHVQKKHGGGVIHNFKEGLWEVVGKIRGSPSQERKRRKNRTPEEILAEIKPHFVKTLTQNDSEEGNELRKELQQNLNGAPPQDVRMAQNGSIFENQFVPKH